MGFAEFVALTAAMQSMTALTIDAMLPALPEIGRDLGTSHPNDVQLVVLIMLLGFGLGQILYGPVSDSIGRKPPIYAGLVIYALGGLVCIFSETLFIMLCGRFLQGIGIASPRIVMNAVIRDRYKGPEMARVMSFVMAVFILVPVIAPILWDEDRKVDIARIANATAKLLECDLELSPSDILSSDEYIGERYGVLTQEGRDALKLVAETEGIFLDPVYTSKAMAGMIDQIRKGIITKNETVVFIHTGGLPALFAYAEDLMLS